MTNLTFHAAEEAAKSHVLMRATHLYQDMHRKVLDKLAFMLGDPKWSPIANDWLAMLPEAITSDRNASKAISDTIQQIVMSMSRQVMDDAMLEDTIVPPRLSLHTSLFLFLSVTHTLIITCCC